MKQDNGGCAYRYRRHRCLHCYTLLRPVRIAHARHLRHCATLDCSEVRHPQHCRSYHDDYPHQYRSHHGQDCRTDYHDHKGYWR